MSVTRENIQAIAKLARLSLTPEEEVRYAEELSAVLSYIDMLNEVDTENIPETTQVAGLADVMRADQAIPANEETRKKIIALFGAREKSMLSVPAVFEDQ